MTESEFNALTWFQRKHAKRIAKSMASEQARKREAMTKEQFLEELERRMVDAGHWSKA